MPSIHERSWLSEALRKGALPKTRTQKSWGGPRRQKGQGFRPTARGKKRVYERTRGVYRERRGNPLASRRKKSTVLGSRPRGAELPVDDIRRDARWIGVSPKFSSGKPTGKRYLGGACKQGGGCFRLEEKMHRGRPIGVLAT